MVALARQSSAGPLPISRQRALMPAVDGTTGEPLLKLPPDFAYKTLSWSLSSTAADGSLAIGLPDGMGAFPDANGKAITLVRNHEITLAPLLGEGPVYDRRCGGGTTTLRSIWRRANGCRRAYRLPARTRTAPAGRRLGAAG